MQESAERRVEVKEFGDLREGMIFSRVRDSGQYGDSYKIHELIGETTYVLARPAYKIFEVSYTVVGNNMPKERYSFSKKELANWNFWVEEKKQDDKNLSSHNPYGVGEESETKGYLEGCTGLRWL